MLVRVMSSAFSVELRTAALMFSVEPRISRPTVDRQAISEAFLRVSSEVHRSVVQVNRLRFQHFHCMAAMAFVFQFDDPVVKCVQLILQMLNFVLDRETRGGKFTNFFSNLLALQAGCRFSPAAWSWLLRRLTKRGPPFVAVPQSREKRLGKCDSRPRGVSGITHAAGNRMPRPKPLNAGGFRADT